MDLAEYVKQLIQCDKETDDIYHKAAVRFGLSDTGMWVLYMLSHADTPLTQQELCRTGFFPKQTVNSVIRQFEADGMVLLEPYPGMKNSKKVVLTAKGREFVKNTIERLSEAEVAAYGRFSEEELETFLAFRKKLNFFLREEIKTMDSEDTIP